jgi:hypothetical protein
MDPMAQPTHFMRGGNDAFKVMHTTATDWDSDNDNCPHTLQLLSFFLLLFCFLLLWRNKRNIVSDDFTHQIAGELKYTLTNRSSILANQRQRTHDGIIIGEGGDATVQQ